MIAVGARLARRAPSHENAVPAGARHQAGGTECAVSPVHLSGALWGEAPQKGWPEQSGSFDYIVLLHRCDAGENVDPRLAIWTFIKKIGVKHAELAINIAPCAVMFGEQ
jgi:hypothetical protein